MVTHLIIVVTGIKQEGKLPEISDERPDKTIKIIVLDLRGNHDPSIENQPASKFKKMPQEIWDNVLAIRIAFKPNQPTDCPIQASSTIDVYTNILPKPVQPTTMLPMYNYVPPLPNPYMTNYMSVMAAAQSIVNANYRYQPQPPPQVMIPPTHIKRKPVQLQPTPFLSPQLEQRIQRKKTPQPTHKKRVRFNEIPQIYHYEPESESESEEVYYTQPYDYYSPQENYYYDNEEGEEEYGDLWKRRNFIKRHASYPRKNLF